MRFDKLVYRKGRSLSAPDLEAFSEIEFDAIAEKTGLKFNDDICDIIKYTLAEYVSLVRVWEDTPSSKKRRGELKKIEKACELLESIFELDACGTLDKFDSLQFDTWKCVKPQVECFLENDEGGHEHLVVKEQIAFDFSERGQLPFNGKNVADYLALCRKRIDEVLSIPHRQGKSEKYAIKRYLDALHQDYILAGGKGRGCWRTADGTYRGPFFVLAKDLLDYTDYSYSESALGNKIIKIINL